MKTIRWDLYTGGDTPDIIGFFFFFVIHYRRQRVTFSHANRKMFHQNDLGTCSVFIILNANELQLEDDSPNTQGFQKWLVIFEGPEFE